VSDNLYIDSFLVPWDFDPAVREFVRKHNNLVKAFEAVEASFVDHAYPLRRVVSEGDAVDHPPHYNQVPGIECIDVVKWFNFNRGAAIKYLWRAGHKDDAIEDLKKAIRYIQYEIERMEEVQRAEEAVQALQKEGPAD